MLGRNSFGNLHIPAFRDEEIQNKKSILYPLIASDRSKVVDKQNITNTKFTFLVHPRDPFDALECVKIKNIGLGALAKFFPDKIEQELKNYFLYKSLAKIPPFIIQNSEITIEGTKVKGNLIAVLLYGEQMLSNSWGQYAKKQIVNAVNLAQKTGSSLIGLGAHTSPATLGGITLRNTNGFIDVSNISDIGITNGNALTAGMSVEAVKRSVKTLGLLPHNARVGIVGASGSVGSATTRLLAELGFILILNGRSIRKLELKFNDIKNSVILSEDLKDMRQCDVIVVMTSATTSTLLPEHVSPGTIVIEDTQPRNIKESAAKIMRKNGSLVIDGGYVHIPGYRCGFNLRLPKEVAFACLAETILLTLEGITTDYSLGDADIDKAKDILELARKHNFSVASPTWNSKPINSATFHNVKINNRIRKKTSKYSS